MNQKLSTTLIVIRWTAIVLIIFIGGWMWVKSNNQPQQATLSSGRASIGGDFTLINQDGVTVTQDDFRGKAMLVYFGYAYCPDVCPLHSEKIASVQVSINQTPMKGLVQFITITTDPKRDTAKAMKAYGAAHGFDPVNWVYLTSGVDQPAATRTLAERYGLKFTQSKDDYQMHAIVTHLIDKSGNLRARYHGLKFDETNMIVHINALTNDSH